MRTYWLYAAKRQTSMGVEFENVRSIQGFRSERGKKVLLAESGSRSRRVSEAGFLLAGASAFSASFQLSSSNNLWHRISISEAPTRLQTMLTNYFEHLPHFADNRGQRNSA